MMYSRPLSALLLVLTLASGCGGPSESAADKTKPAHAHDHVAPHGGTAVVLGAEAFHLELVRDAATGKMTAYVMDGELEKFVRVSAPSFEVIASVGGRNENLRFVAVANPATGEVVGNTAQFEAQADWLKTTSHFEAELKELEIRGVPFRSVKFAFPEGNDHDEKVH